MGVMEAQVAYARDELVRFGAKPQPDGSVVTIWIGLFQPGEQRKVRRIVRSYDPREWPYGPEGDCAKDWNDAGG
jgi:hypothetical protein